MSTHDDPSTPRRRASSGRRSADGATAAAAASAAAGGVPPRGVSGHEQTMSDARLGAGTGRSAEQWFALLDAAGSATRSHTQIARWLVDEHEVPGWWAQSITVRYEQARGMRLPGQQADGTFSVSVSRSLRGGQLELLDLAVERFAAFAGGPPDSTSRSAKHPTARWRLPSDESLLLTVAPPVGGKCSVSLTLSRLRLPERVEPVKQELTRAFRVVSDRQN
ncbi:DUF4287 domain-containing protein [Frigoribacterium endophyticum]|uniref:DUF4287 domain-containing protein n=1 Tax=Frigoribacterium endophyticum TaxID=1522176 RepID=UPI001ABA244C|nr:hypothetical protein [Frigoribacterium endophyticum]